MNTALHPRCVVIIAGEASGDLHGSGLVEAMRRKNANLFFCGIGGPALKRAGVRILADAAQLAVVGITEVFGRAPAIYKALSTIKRILRTLKPDLLVLIDFPDFNLHVAATAKKNGIPVLYYISPQIWAWRPGRVKRIARLVDHMAVILPFEEDFYRSHHVPATFVGHPLLDAPLPAPALTAVAGDTDEVGVGLVPGSRQTEIVRHLPVMLDAAELLTAKFPGLRFFISQAPSVEKKQIESIIRARRRSPVFKIISTGIEDIFKNCDLIVAASGTVTLQAAIYGIPMVIIYRLSPFSYWLGRALVRVENIGLVNLVAGRQVVPELIQAAASAPNIAATVGRMLSDTAGLQRLRQELAGLRNLLGTAGASERVAAIALGMLDKYPHPDASDAI